MPLSASPIGGTWKPPCDLQLVFWLQISTSLVWGGAPQVWQHVPHLSYRGIWGVAAFMPLSASPIGEHGIVPTIPGFPSALTKTLPIASAGASLPRSPVSMLTSLRRTLCARSFPPFAFPLLAQARSRVLDYGNVFTTDPIVLFVHSKTLIVWIFYYLTGLLANGLVDLIWWFFCILNTIWKCLSVLAIFCHFSILLLSFNLI